MYTLFIAMVTCTWVHYFSYISTDYVFFKSQILKYVYPKKTKTINTSIPDHLDFGYTIGLQTSQTNK